jgi:hypothetical protein
MGEEVVTLVRIPIHEIEEMIRRKHVLPSTMVDVQLESDFLVLYFSDKSKDVAVNVSAQVPASLLIKKRKRRAYRRRHRTKTRGWGIVTRMTNKKGQTCAIYKPFVDALSRPLSPEEQRAIVIKILKSNGNKPSETTVNYFLENTVEYLTSIQGSGQKIEGD